METREQVIARVEIMARRMRKRALGMALSAGSNGAHVGPGLSIIEITATLYGAIMKINPQNPQWEDRDRFILSKGHGTLGYYTALAEAGLFDADELSTFEVNEGSLPGQPTLNMAKGIEFSSGSLGLGLSLGIGVAMTAKRMSKGHKTFVLMGDGECNEGTVWEAAMAASHYGLNNLIAIIDRNCIQSDGGCSTVMCMGDMAGKWRSFGWDVAEVDGHNICDIYDAFINTRCDETKPYVVIASTIKGKGVSFMENNNAWHHARLSQEQYDAAMLELTAQ